MKNMIDFYAKYIPIFADIEQLLTKTDKDQILVAVDGQCASGKSILGQLLAQTYDANLFHMDDFFLRPKQRTKERLKEVGGNVDYERFKEEVLTPLKQKEEFCYRIYDCCRQCFTEEVRVPVKRLNIIEGAYSRHPYFGDCYDLVYCLTIEEEEQKKRIRERNGSDMLKRFLEEWIPKENAYLEKFGIMENTHGIKAN